MAPGPRYQHIFEPWVRHEGDILNLIQPKHSLYVVYAEIADPPPAGKKDYLLEEQ